MSALSFAVPFVLVGLIALPALYYLLRLTPPPPRRLPLPTLPLVQDILGKEREPSRTPWWLLLIRLGAAAAIILAMAGPRWQPQSHELPSTQGPLLLLIDDGWSSAQDWKARIEKAAALLADAQSRPILLMTASDETPQITPDTARAASSRLLSLVPQPWRAPRQTMLDTAASLLTSMPDLGIIWISDGVTIAAEQELITNFLAKAGNRLAIIADQNANPMALTGLANGNEALLKRARAESTPQSGLVRALDEKGRLLGEATFQFAARESEAKARFSLPLELVNDITRLEIADQRQAGGVHLVDAANRRRRVALISGETTDTAQHLVSARYFVSRALQPYADLREPPRGVPDPIGRALDERPDILLLIDIGTLSGETGEKVARFVENGGMLIRFAGSGLAAASDDLLPVRLRRGGRILGGALSWDKPRKIGPIPDASPFAGLQHREDVQVERQVLAEPDSDLNRASWLVLDDGTPLITGAQRGRGQIVLFHVTGDTGWSNLPISGLFVDVLRRTLQLAKGQISSASEAGTGTQKLAPRLNLDGHGVLGSASVLARPIEARHVDPASRAHPPGFYGPVESSLAVNTILPSEPFTGIAYGTKPLVPLSSAANIDFRPLLMLLAILLLIADALAVLWLSGGLRRVRGAAGFAALALLVFTALPQDQARAQQAAPSPPRAEDVRSALKPRLAYVITGNAQVDEASRLGLTGLGQVLSQRTAIHLDEPIGLDPARDELVFYSMIYWPLLPDQANPPESAIRAIDAFMKNGGTVLFDTRDAFIQRPGGQPTPETRALRRMLSSLDIPALETVPADHVLTKTFYLLDRMTGRYMAGDTWVEAISGTKDTKVPARAGDRVSPIIITSNDLAAAWAVDRLGRPLYPLVPGEPRQREYALRTGVNLVMYVMTGNYKADQVHVKDLLERLGQ